MRYSGKHVIDKLSLRYKNWNVTRIMKDFIRIAYTEPLGDNRFLYSTTDGRTFIGPFIDFKTSDTVVVEASDGPGPDGKWVIINSKVVDVIRHGE
jgi:hypothetical protein